MDTRARAASRRWTLDQHSGDLRREIRRAVCQTSLYSKVFHGLSGVSRGSESMQDAHDLHKAA